MMKNVKTVNVNDEQRLERKAQIYSQVYGDKHINFHYDAKSGVMTNDGDPYVFERLNEFL